MRHRIKGKKLNRDSGHRKALRMNLATQLFEKGRIKTTRAKADYVRGFAERLITLSKRGLAKAEETGKGAFSLDGKMVDLPIIEKAKKVIEKAKRYNLL